MGCTSSAAAETKVDRPELKSSTPVCSGGDKDIFDGSYKGKDVVVAIVRPGRSDDRLLNEIQMFKDTGKHPYIIDMVNAGKWDGRTYLVFETVKPIGYDLARLRNQYSFLSQAVPSALMARLMNNTADALNFMHQRGMIHKDVKADNVLVTKDYQAKLIDMGIAQKKGPCEQLRAPYLAPELCKGGTLGPEVDCWGLGVILHQVYQSGKWRLLSCGPNESVKMMNGMPCLKNPMEEPLKEAMLALLKVSPTQRWTIPQFKAGNWLSSVQQGGGKDWSGLDPMSSQATGDMSKQAKSKHVREWRSIEPPPPALAALIGKGQRHLIGKPLGGMGFHKKHNATVLLIDKGAHGGFVKVPGPNVILDEGNWIYFGVGSDQSEEFDKCQDGLQQKFYGETADGKASDGRGAEAGSFVAFTLEFDCFTFPDHVGKKAMIGKGAAEGPQSFYGSGEDPALDLRSNFHINLMGIHRIGEQYPEFFPKANSTVCAGDIGLVVRIPEKSGASKSTVTDADLEPLMNLDKFKKIMSQSNLSSENSTGTFYGKGNKKGQELVLRQKEGFATVRMYKNPDTNEQEVIGEITSGDRVVFIDEHGEFLKVKYKNLEGWVGQKNVANPDEPVTPA